MNEKDVQCISYVEKEKLLTVIFDDGRELTYQNVETPAAHAMMASQSLTYHYRKYIQGIYLPINGPEEGKNVV